MLLHLIPENNLEFISWNVYIKSSQQYRLTNVKIILQSCSCYVKLLVSSHFHDSQFGTNLYIRKQGKE